MSELEKNNDWIKAGFIASQTLQFGKELIKKNKSVLEICQACDNKIRELGGTPAFPTQVSCDDVAAHFCPDKKNDFNLNEHLVSLDVGACYNGAIGDNALTIDLSGKYKDLVKASREALNNASKILQIGTPIGQVGKVIQETIESYGYSPIKNLSGHGLGRYNIHTKPSMPNYDTHDGSVLQKGMTIAIEPFATNGQGEIYQSSNATIFMLAKRKPVRSIFARQILQEVDKLKGLPFTTRWLIEDRKSVV